MQTIVQDFFNQACCTQQQLPPCNAVVNAVNAIQQGNDVLINWTANGAISFDVYMDNVFKTNTVNFSYVFANGADGNNHTYNIVPHCLNGTGTANNSQFNFAAPLQPCTASVTNVSTTQQGNNVIINWNGANAASYDVYVDNVFKVNTANTTYTATGLADGNNHTFNIVAKCQNGSGTSQGGTFQYAAPCTAVINSVSTQQQNQDVVISWTANGATSYDVYVDNVFKLNTANTSYTATNIANGIQHTFNIVPRCQTGTGTPMGGSFTYSFPLPCQATVSNINATRQGNDVLLTWNGANAVSYDVYIDNVFKVNTANTSYLAVQAANNQQHSYSIVPRCANGVGPTQSGSFLFDPTNIYVKIVKRNSAYINDPNHTETNEEVWIDFFSDPQGTQPLDLTGLGVTLHWNQHEYLQDNQCNVNEADYPGSQLGVSTKIKIFEGVTDEAIMDPFFPCDVLTRERFQITAGSYIII